MKRYSVILLFGLMSLSLPGCDVWEDRDMCPSYLILDCSRLEGDRADIWVFREDGSLDCRTSVSGQELKAVQRFQIKKGNYLCIVWTDIGNKTVTTDLSSLSGALYKAASGDADPLFSYSGEVSCSKDSVRVDAIPRKMFINVTVIFKSLKEEDNVRLCLNSSWGGFTLAGDGIKQENSVLSEGRDTVRMRIFRPFSFEGLNLELTVLFGDGTPVDSDFDLGEFLRDNNYDLTEDMLKDIYITVDVSCFKTEIKTDPWDEVPPVVINY